MSTCFPLLFSFCSGLQAAANFIATEARPWITVVHVVVPGAVKNGKAEAACIRLLPCNSAGVLVEQDSGPLTYPKLSHLSPLHLELWMRFRLCAQVDDLAKPVQSGDLKGQLVCMHVEFTGSSFLEWGTCHRDFEHSQPSMDHQVASLAEKHAPPAPDIATVSVGGDEGMGQKISQARWRSA